MNFDRWSIEKRRSGESTEHKRRGASPARPDYTLSTREWTFWF
jgi:hypothetical protein